MNRIAAATLLLCACATSDPEEVDDLNDVGQDVVCQPPYCGDPGDTPIFVTCYADKDHDGHFGGTGRKIENSCPANMSVAKTDCNDNDASFWAYQFHVDKDHDGHGAPGDDNIRISCYTTPPAGTVANADDCDDNRADIMPRSCMFDDDNDGFWNAGIQCVQACPTLPKPNVSISTSPGLAMVGQPLTASWSISAPPHCRLQFGNAGIYDGYVPSTGAVHGLIANRSPITSTSGSITGVPNVSGSALVLVDVACATADRNMAQVIVPVHEVTTTTTLFMLQVKPVVIPGWLPYANTFTLYGNDHSGHMRSIQNFSTTALAFVKPGHSTTECGDPSAVVVVPPSGYVDMNALYGVPQTGLPLGIIACRQADGNAPANVNLSVTYDYLN